MSAPTVANYLNVSRTAGRRIRALLGVTIAAAALLVDVLSVPSSSSLAGALVAVSVADEKCAVSVKLSRSDSCDADS